MPPRAERRDPQPRTARECERERVRRRPQVEQRLAASSSGVEGVSDERLKDRGEEKRGTPLTQNVHSAAAAHVAQASKRTSCTNDADEWTARLQSIGRELFPYLCPRIEIGESALGCGKYLWQPCNCGKECDLKLHIPLAA